MHRVKNAIADYKRFIDKTGRGALYLDDIYDVYKMNRCGEELDVAGCIGDAMEAGFMIGYRCAKREKKRSNKGAAV